MVRDGVINIVEHLRQRGFDPRNVGHDLWIARCPGHGSDDRALAISRNEFNHVELECRSIHKCTFARIIAALGLTNGQVYAETPDWLISRLSRLEVQPELSKDAQAKQPAALDDEASGSHQSHIPAAAAEPPNIPDPADALLDDHPQAPRDAEFSPENGAPDERSATEASSLVATNPLVNDPRPAVPEAMISPEGGTPAESGATESGGLQPADDGFDPIQPCVSPGPKVQELCRAGESLPSLFHASFSEEAGVNLERLSSMQILARLTSNMRLFRSADGRFCAQVAVGDRLEIYALKSAGFRDWLIDGYLTRQPEPPSSWAIRRVVGMLEARARFNTGTPELFIRVGQGDEGSGSPYFLDLGDPSGRAVAISDQGWSLVDQPSADFRRPEGLLPLPVPARDGSIDLLRRYVNLTEPEFRLMIAWLTAALRPVGPYPILVLNGEQASGKSTLARVLRMLIDPQTCTSLALPKSTHDLMATAVNGWLLLYENISTLRSWLSDGLCQLAFGAGFASRALYTNDDRNVIVAQRPVILVGIDDFVARGDLRDRSVFLHLQPIPQTSRRSERSFWPQFRADYPRILGGVLDAIAGGLRELPSVDLRALPRMADYAEWGEATSRALGWGTETFLSTYNDNRKEATAVLLEDSAVATVVLALARQGINWSGKPLELYNTVAKLTGIKAGSGWPKNISMFGSELRRIAPQVRLHGLSITFERKGGDRIVTLRSDTHAVGRPPSETPKR